MGDLAVGILNRLDEAADTLWSDGDEAKAKLMDDAQIVIQAQAAEIKRLREALAHLANTINIVGSHYHRAQVAIDDLVLDVKKSARAALRETK
jgi:hypothetical protein